MSLVQIRWLLCVGVLSFVPVLAQEASDTEWMTYGGDLASTRYSPADQINADNFNDLEVAWRLKTHNFGPTPEYNFQSTPLMVDGVLYTTAGSRRAVVAADAGTGELLWMHRLDEGERGAAAPRRLSGRGLAYRDDGRSGQILYVTPGYQLIALDAATGQPIPSFGRDGIVDLKQDMDQDIDSVTGEVGLHAAPIVAGDTLLIGAAHLPGSAPRSMENIKGYVRGFDARTGERRWIFHTIPGADEFGNDTWLNESWRYTGNTGSWGQMSIDEELGVAYFATEMPTNDYYGGHRHGDNLFADSLVAVDLETGSGCGTTSSSTTMSGTGTSRAHRSWPTSRSRVGRSRRWRSQVNKDGSMSSTERRESRSGQSTSDRSKPRTCRASCWPQPSPSRQSLRHTTGRVSGPTT